MHTAGTQPTWPHKHYPQADIQDTAHSLSRCTHTTFNPTYSRTHNRHSTFFFYTKLQAQNVSSHTSPALAHRPLCTHRGTLSTHSHPTLALSSSYATGPGGSRGKPGPTAARLPAGVSVSGAQSWKVSTRTSAWARAMAGAPPTAPGPRVGGGGAAAGARRAGARAEQRGAERDWRRVRSGSRSKRGADVRPAAGSAVSRRPLLAAARAVTGVPPPVGPAAPLPHPGTPAWRSGGPA